MKSMLVCLDGSKRQRGVLDAAVELGRRTGAKLVLFRSILVVHDLPPEAYTVSPDRIPELLGRKAREELEGLEVSVPPELRGGIRVVVGVPWQSIDRTAREEDVDLIVLGSHGFTVFDRIVGTIAAKIVNHADRAVLVVRAPERLLPSQEAA